MKVDQGETLREDTGESGDDVFYDARAYRSMDMERERLVFFVLSQEAKQRIVSKRDQIYSWLQDTGPKGGAALKDAIQLMVLGCSIADVDKALETFFRVLCARFDIPFDTKPWNTGDCDVLRSEITGVLQNVSDQPFSNTSSGEQTPNDDGSGGRDSSALSDLLSLTVKADFFPFLRVYLLAAYLRCLALILKGVVPGDKAISISLCWRARLIMSHVMRYGFVS